MKYTEVNSTTAEIKFYGYIGMWWMSAKDFTDTIEEIEKKYTELIIRTHCYGGEVFEGNVMFNTLQRTKLNVTFVIDGVSASMSAIVMLAGNKRKAASNAFVMIHAPSGYTSGGSSDHFSTGKLLKSMELNGSKAFAKITGKPVKDFEAMMDGTDHWLSAQECLDMGLIDEIIDPLADVRLDKPDAGTPVEKIFGLYAAIAAPINNLPQQNNNDMTKEQRQALITQHNLTNVTADSSDTAVLDAVNAKITALTTENANLKQTATGGVTAQAEAIIAAKEVELKTKFTPEQKTKFTTIATSLGVEQMKSILDEIKPVAVITDMITGDKETPGADGAVIAADRKTWDLAMWAEKDPDGLEAMSKAPAGSPEEKAFNALYNAAHKTQYAV